MDLGVPRAELDISRGTDLPQQGCGLEFSHQEMS
jgi:hypothetical protein